jgi:hypothetical protein
VLDHFESDRDLEAFVQEYGTGNSIPNAPEFDPQLSDSSASDGIPVTTHISRYTRRAKRQPAPAPPYGNQQVVEDSAPELVTPTVRQPEPPSSASNAIIPGRVPDIPPPPPPQEPIIPPRDPRRESTALPQPPTNTQTYIPANENVAQAPTNGDSSNGGGKKILFYGSWFIHSTGHHGHN